LRLQRREPEASRLSFSSTLCRTTTIEPILPQANPIPTQWPWLFKGFRRYSARYLRKHFHAVRLSRSSPPIPLGNGEPLIFVVNHPGWWDVLVTLMLTSRYDHYRHYAPIEAAMLPKYPVFSRLGFFGVDASPRGAARFLRTVAAIFSKPHAALWITAQGEFTDVRKRPVVLRPGVGYVAERLERGWVVPVSLEYPFWNERPPEALIRFGDPIRIEDFPTLSREEWTLRIAASLEANQDALAAEAVQRDAALFEVLIDGKTGVGGVYDTLRRWMSWLRGKRFDGSHTGQNKKLDDVSVEEKK